MITPSDKAFAVMLATNDATLRNISYGPEASTDGVLLSAISYQLALATSSGREPLTDEAEAKAKADIHKRIDELWDAAVDVVISSGAASREVSE